MMEGGICMFLSIIVAMDRNGLIGTDTGIPWHLPRDLRWFKDCTMSKPVIMGRRTFQLIGKPLPGRHNIVLSHDLRFLAPGCEVAHSGQEAIAQAKNYLQVSGGKEAMVV